MNKTVKIIFIVLGILSFFSLLFYFLNFKKSFISLMSIEQVFKDIEKKYGKSIAENVEKIYRLESGHFTSEIYSKTGGAGMLSFKDIFPHGWTNMENFWNENEKYAPAGIYEVYNNTETQIYKYLIFNNFGGFYTLAEFLKINNNNPGRWYSLAANEQDYYNGLIDNIQVTYTA